MKNKNYKNELDKIFIVLKHFEKKGLDFSSLKSFSHNLPDEFKDNVFNKNIITGMFNNDFKFENKKFRSIEFQDRNFPICVNGLIMQSEFNDNIEQIKLWSIHEKNIKHISHPLIEYYKKTKNHEYCENYFYNSKANENAVIFKKVTTNNFVKELDFESEISIQNLKNLLSYANEDEPIH